MYLVLVQANNITGTPSSTQKDYYITTSPLLSFPQCSVIINNKTLKWSFFSWDSTQVYLRPSTAFDKIRLLEDKDYCEILRKQISLAWLFNAVAMVSRCGFPISGGIVVNKVRGKSGPEEQQWWRAVDCRKPLWAMCIAMQTHRSRQHRNLLGRQRW